MSKYMYTNINARLFRAILLRNQSKKMYLTSTCLAGLYIPHNFKLSVVMRLIRKISNDPVRRRAMSSAREHGALKVTSNNAHM